ncbi:hypothetical protein FSP39_005525 [Pinctada imbricata]|uniref:Uncharacterized protein n=1 Tax=Pinctada imbricata TaxID=66713 RepID=A0AA89CD56_PINIB|nr:hypothetical protein FSP39_005525 [Pinctada imbricata]
MDISNSKRKISSSSDSETNSKQFKGFHVSTSTTYHACQSCGSRESRPSSPILVSDLEKSTRQWTQYHLDILRIYHRLRKSHLVDPVDFIQENMTHFLGYKGMKDYNDLKAKYISEQYNITQCMVDLMNMIEIDFNHFKYVTIESITKMKTDLKRWRRQMLDNNVSEELTDICLRTEVYGQSFAEQLEYMVTMMNMNGHVMEGMYQQLFMLYLQMFGLKVYGFTNIANGSMDIKLNNVMAMNTGIQTITSDPDLLIMDNKNLSSIEVTAVVEVRYISVWYSIFKEAIMTQQMCVFRDHWINGRLGWLCTHNPDNHTICY